MRIIGGKYRGKKLPISSKLDLRPTTDFAKESLFNVLQNLIDLDEITFLDLFAGTGNISFELMSRGAARGQAVDLSLASFKYRETFKRGMEMAGLRNFRSDTFKFARTTTWKYDLIFADPPYALEKLPELPELIFKHELLKPEGLFVLEHPEEHTFGAHPQFLQHRKYGRVNFTFFKAES